MNNYVFKKEFCLDISILHAMYVLQKVMDWMFDTFVMLNVAKSIEKVLRISNLNGFVDLNACWDNLRYIGMYVWILKNCVSISNVACCDGIY